MTTPNDTNEPSLASDGSQPAAWGAVAPDGSVGWMMRKRENVEGAVADGTPIVPLYRQTQPTLTDEEREVIFRAMYRAAGADSAILWSLLERTK